MIKAIVFDLDGTLLDTAPDIAAALNRALAACGLPTHGQKTVEAFLGGGIRDAVIKAAPKGTCGETIERVLELYRDDYVAHCTERTALYDGVREMVDGFAARGWKLGILSNKTEATARKIVAHFFPEGQFAAVFGRVPERPLKPNADAAKPVLEALGVEPGEIAYVGDSNTDILFAKAVGMLPVAAPWGYRSRAELVGAGAELIARNARELLELLQTEGQTMLHMIVEQTRDYPMRMEFDPNTGRFHESEHRSLAFARGFTKPYGWIRESGTPPQPHWDCILLSERAFALGDEVEIRVIGVFQRGDGDHKYIAVETCREIDDLAQITDEEREELRRLYPHVREGEGWFGRERAQWCMEHHEKAL